MVLVGGAGGRCWWMELVGGAGGWSWWVLLVGGAGGRSWWAALVGGAHCHAAPRLVVGSKSFIESSVVYVLFRISMSNFLVNFLFIACHRSH